MDSIDPKTIEKLNGFLESGKKIFLAQSGIQTDLQTQQATPIESNIFDFLNQYNLNLQKNLVLDSKCGNVSVQQRQGIFLMNRPMEYPFFPVIDSFNSEEVVVSDLEQVLTFFSSEIMIDTVGRENISKTVSLFKSSNNSGLMEQNFMLSPDPQQNPFIHMFGQEGKTLAASSELKTGGEIMLVSDSKFFVDEGGLSAQINLVFLMNAVDYLAGDEDLIALRSREITSRPLRELEDSTKKKWKYANMLLPSFLIIGFGVMRMRKEKHQADILKQIYD